MSIIQDYLNVTPCYFFEQTPVKKCLIRFIQKYGNSGGSSGVTTFNTRSGDVTLQNTDVTTALGFTPPSTTPNLLIAATNASGNLIDGTANIISRTLNGFIVGSNTAIVAADTILLAFGKTQGQIAARATLASPTFTGVPAAPTAAIGTSTTQIATTAFVLNQLNSRRLSAAQTLDFPDTAGGDSADLTIAVTGADEGDPVALGVPNVAMFEDSFYLAWVSAADVVTIRFMNISLASIDPPSAEFRVVVSKF